MGRWGDGEKGEASDSAFRTSHSAFTPRRVTIVNAGYRKPLDLLVETVVEDFRSMPGDSIWPSLIPRVVELIHEHKTTLVFVNDRRQAERTADLNEQMAAEGGMRNRRLLRNSQFAIRNLTHPTPSSPPMLPRG